MLFYCAFNNKNAESYYSHTVGIWIDTSSGIQMIENSLIVEWSLIQTTIWEMKWWSEYQASISSLTNVNPMLGIQIPTNNFEINITKSLFRF